MQWWLWFWITIGVISNLLFFGVAVRIAVKGWAELRDLLRQTDDTPKRPPP